MDAAIKQRWTTALTSGEYLQGHGELRQVFEGVPGTAYYCCLGVLCELARHDGVVTSETGASEPGESGGVTTYRSVAVRGDRSNDYLPGAVMQWAGLDSSDPMAGSRRLSSWNDHDTAFSDIAALIEEHL